MTVSWDSLFDRAAAYDVSLEAIRTTTDEHSDSEDGDDV
ncbi:hypothetical protein SAMN05421752_112149 [Natronorubrum thiooxidans]|uniref:Uncharacterized protein n=1 Tax=Natronorubrum thiooxidans TaxID=308853 RepID=A0A1N7GJD1_9EURY|nr:hypothetical protein SAMN05421752_112149 [Natronorubrum thiooxidans]